MCKSWKYKSPTWWTLRDVAFHRWTNAKGENNPRFLWRLGLLSIATCYPFPVVISTIYLSPLSFSDLWPTQWALVHVVFPQFIYCVGIRMPMCSMVIRGWNCNAIENGGVKFIGRWPLAEWWDVLKAYVELASVTSRRFTSADSTRLLLLLFIRFRGLICIWKATLLTLLSWSLHAITSKSDVQRQRPLTGERRAFVCAIISLHIRRVIATDYLLT